jgi:four helix bundle protein
MTLAEMSYRLTKSFPKDELYGMVTQIRRAAVSIPANIAEGYGRETLGAYLQFLRVAQGSLKELETHVILAVRVALVKTEAVAPLLIECEELGKMLRTLIRTLEEKAEGSRK